MRTIYLFLLFFILSFSTYCQNIINVNNTASASSTDLGTLQEAITAAVDGDVIYLSPSPTSYGAATIDKQVTIFGPGYLVANNPDLEISTYTGRGIIDNVTINAAGSGTYISGCDLNYVVIDGSSNLYIARNRMRFRMYLKNTSNIVIEGNYFDYTTNTTGSSTDGNWMHLSANTNNSNLIIRNNIFYAYAFYSGSCFSQSYNKYLDNIYIGSTSNAIVEHNIFRDRCHFNNSIVRNNIFLMTDQYSSCADNPIAFNASTTVLKNNILVKNQSGLDASNMVGVTSPIFEGYPTQGTRSFDDRFVLIASSPANGAGVDGVDCGVFDGPAPYKLSGVPIIPVIYELTGPSQGTSASGIDINVKVRSNN